MLEGSPGWTVIFTSCDHGGRVMKGQIIYSRDGSTCRCYIGDKEVSREEFDKAFPPKPLGEPLAAHLPGCWPMPSDALAVHPSRIEEAMEDAKKKGVPTTFDAEGRAILTDRGHRKKYLKAYGYHDNHGGYGD